MATSTLDFTQTPTFKTFEEEQLNVPVPRDKSVSKDVPNLLIRDLYAQEPPQGKQYVKRLFLNQIINGKAEKYLNDTIKDLGIQESGRRDWVLEQFAKQFEALGGSSRLDEDITYARSYSQINPIDPFPQNNKGWASVTPQLLGGGDLYGDLQMGMGDQLTPTQANIDLQQEGPQPLNYRQQILAANGGDYRTSLMAEFHQDESFGERWRDPKNLLWWNINNESPIHYKLLLLPDNLTRQEGTKFIRANYDPDAIVSYIDSQDITQGLKVYSPILGKLVPFDDIGEGIFGAGMGDTTFKTRGEMHGLLADDMMQMFLGELGPEIVGIGPMAGMAHFLKKGGKDHITKQGLTTKALIGGGKLAALAAAAAIPAALFKWTMLNQARKTGILDMTQERAWEASKLFGYMVAGGSVVGDLAMMMGGTILNRMTGENLDQSIVNRFRQALANYEKQQGTPPRLGMQGPSTRPTYGDPDPISIPKPSEEMGDAEANVVLSKIAKSIGEDTRKDWWPWGDDFSFWGKDYNLKYTDLVPGREFESDDVLMDMMAAILEEMGESESSRVAIEKMFTRRGKILEGFFTDLMNRAGVRDPNLQKSAYAHYLEVIKNVMGQEAKKMTTDLQDKTPTRLLTDLDPDAIDVPTVMNQQVNITDNRVSKAYGDTESRIMLERRERMRDPYNKLDELLSSNEVNQIPQTKLHEHIGPMLRNMLKGGDAPIKTEEYKEAVEFMRDRIPMIEGKKDPDSKIRTIALLLEGKDVKAKEEIVGWDLSQLIEARFNLMTWKGSDNSLIRENARKLITGFDEAIEATLEPLGEDISGQILGAIDKRVLSYRENVDGRLLLDIVESQNPAELATNVFKMPLEQTGKLLDLLGKADLENKEVGSRVIALRRSVLEHIRNNVINSEDGAVKQNKQFREFMKKHDKQMRLLFPAADVNKPPYTGWGDLKNFATWSKKQEKVIAFEAKELDDLNKIFASGEFEKLSPLKLIKDFFEADPLKLEESGTMRELKKLSKLADEYPELRDAMRDVFVEYMSRNLLQPRTGELTPGFKMSAEGFDITELLRLAHGGYGGAIGLKRMEANFDLILGPGVGKDYVRQLRYLAREVDKLNNVYKRAASQLGSSGGRDIATEQGDRTVMRWIIPPLTQFGRRATLLLEKLSMKSKRHFLEIASDPYKLDALLSLRDRRMDRRTIAKVLAFIAENPSKDVGGEVEMELGDRQLSRFIFQPKEELVKELDVMKKATGKYLLESSSIKQASGGSVGAALQRAEARTRHVQRGR